MAKDQGATPTTTKGAKGAPRAATPVRPPPKGPTQVVTKRKINPATFFAEVRAEARKVTWTSWKETWITSVMVGIMVVITSIFFLLVDGSLSFLMQQLLKLAGG
jgi:preprotein translocase subunit SecE